MEEIFKKAKNAVAGKCGIQTLFEGVAVFGML